MVALVGQILLQSSMIRHCKLLAAIIASIILCHQQQFNINIYEIIIIDIRECDDVWRHKKPHRAITGGK